MKETFESLIAAIGCFPLMAIGLFLVGVLMGHVIALVPPRPAEWVIVSAFLLPLCSTLYFRAYSQQQESGQWLTAWRASRHQANVVDSPLDGPRKTIEDVWFEHSTGHRLTPPAIQSLFDHALLWGWATAISFLSLAYVCIWFGLTL